MGRNTKAIAAGPFGQLVEQRIGVIKTKSWLWGASFGAGAMFILEWIL